MSVKRSTVACYKGMSVGRRLIVPAMFCRKSKPTRLLTPAVYICGLGGLNVAKNIAEPGTSGQADSTSNQAMLDVDDTVELRRNCAGGSHTRRSRPSCGLPRRSGRVQMRRYRPAKLRRIEDLGNNGIFDYSEMPGITDPKTAAKHSYVMAWRSAGATGGRISPSDMLRQPKADVELANDAFRSLNIKDGGRPHQNNQYLDRSRGAVGRITGDAPVLWSGSPVAAEWKPVVSATAAPALPQRLFKAQKVEPIYATVNKPRKLTQPASLEPIYATVNKPRKLTQPGSRELSYASLVLPQGLTQYGSSEPLYASLVNPQGQTQRESSESLYASVYNPLRLSQADSSEPLYASVYNPLRLSQAESPEPLYASVAMSLKQGEIVNLKHPYSSLVRPRPEGEATPPEGEATPPAPGNFTEQPQTSRKLVFLTGPDNVGLRSLNADKRSVLTHGERAALRHVPNDAAASLVKSLQHIATKQRDIGRYIARIDPKWTGYQVCDVEKLPFLRGYLLRRALEGNLDDDRMHKFKDYIRQPLDVTDTIVPVNTLMPQVFWDDVRVPVVTKRGTVALSTERTWTIPRLPSEMTDSTVLKIIYDKEKKEMVWCVDNMYNAISRVYHLSEARGPGDQVIRFVLGKGVVAEPTTDGMLNVSCRTKSGTKVSVKLRAVGEC